MKKILALIFAISFCVMFTVEASSYISSTQASSLGSAVSPPAPMPLSVYYLDAQEVTVGNTIMMIGGVPNSKIRIFNYGIQVSEGIFSLYDSITGTIIATGQSGGGGGYIEISAGASLMVSFSADCVVTAYIVGVVS